MVISYCPAQGMRAKKGERKAANKWYVGLTLGCVAIGKACPNTRNQTHVPASHTVREELTDWNLPQGDMVLFYSLECPYIYLRKKWEMLKFTSSAEDVGDKNYIIVFPTFPWSFSNLVVARVSHLKNHLSSAQGTGEEKSCPWVAKNNG